MYHRDSCVLPVMPHAQVTDMASFEEENFLARWLQAQIGEYVEIHLPPEGV